MKSWFRSPPQGRRAAPRLDGHTPQQRLAICRGCPQLTRDGRCTHCGCFMRVKSKKNNATCPEGRWK